MDKAKIIERIQKMLALSKNNTNIHEAETAAAMATRLMQKYNFEMADVIAGELEGEDSIVNECADDEWLYTGGRFAPWINILGTGIAKIYDCESKFELSKKIYGKVALHFLGYKVDVEVSKYTFLYVSRTISKLAATAWDQAEWSTKREYTIITFKNSFYLGAVKGFLARMREMKEAENAAHAPVYASGRDLVLLKKTKIAEKFGKQKYHHSGAQPGSYDAFQHGVKVGREINVRPAVGSNPVNANSLSHKR